MPVRATEFLVLAVRLAAFLCVTQSYALITRSVGAHGDYPTITAALAALSPFSDNVVLQVNTGFNGYEEQGADYNSTTNFNGHSLDLLAAQASTSQITYYVGSDVEYRTDADGNLETVESVHGGAFSARRVYEGKGAPSGTEYLVKNHLGSTVAMTDEQGHSLGTYYEYTAYGTQDKLQSGPTARVTQTFTGKELDEDVDLYYFGARYYDPDLSLWLSSDAMRQFHSPYAYSPNPLSTVDPDGNDAVPIAFPEYKVSALGTKWRGLGHAGVLLIENKTGATKYYEFGRYDAAGKGLVRTFAVPNVKMAGKTPTTTSLAHTLAYISTKAGHGGPISAAYISNNNFSAMNKYAAAQLGAARKDYNICTNNCGTFMTDVVKAGGVDLPLMLDPRPNSMIKEIRDKFPDIDYSKGSGLKRGD